jgi:hypothetical protein
VAGLIGSDSASVISGLTVSTPADATSPIGTYPITSSGGVAVDYVITVRTDGTLTVNALLADTPGYSNSLTLITGNGAVANNHINAGTLTTNGGNGTAPGGNNGATQSNTLMCVVSNSSATSESCGS